jgi:hypothetical protein
MFSFHLTVSIMYSMSLCGIAYSWREPVWGTRFRRIEGWRGWLSNNQTFRRREETNPRTVASNSNCQSHRTNGGLYVSDDSYSHIVVNLNSLNTNLSVSMSSTWTVQDKILSFVISIINVYYITLESEWNSELFLFLCQTSIMISELHFIHWIILQFISFFVYNGYSNQFNKQSNHANKFNHSPQ